MRHGFITQKHPSWSAFLITVALVLGLTMPPSARAVEPEVQRDVLVLIRALAYDRNLSKRAGDTITVGVLYRGDAPTGEAQDVLAVVEALKDVKVGGLGLRSVAIPLADAAALTTNVTARSVNALFLPTEYAADQEMVSSVTREANITSLTRDHALIERGIALGVVSAEGQPRITVNLSAAKEEGASFGADLLRLAEVIR